MKLNAEIAPIVWGQKLKRLLFHFTSLCHGAKANTTKNILECLHSVLVTQNVIMHRLDMFVHNRIYFPENIEQL